MFAHFKHAGWWMSHKSVIACLILTLTYATHTLKGEVCGAKIGLQLESWAAAMLKALCRFRNLEFTARLQKTMAILRADYLTTWNHLLTDENELSPILIGITFCVLFHKPSQYWRSNYFFLLSMWNKLSNKELRTKSTIGIKVKCINWYCRQQLYNPTADLCAIANLWLPILRP